jgi:hypothetical protein
MSDAPDRAAPPGGPPREAAHDDDPVLAALGALARDEAARGPDADTLAELERLAAGDLPAEDHARLVGALPRETVALFEPLDARFRARATDAALSGLGLAPHRAVPADAGPTPRLAPIVALPAPPADRRRLLFVTLPLVAAAAVALWVMRPAPPPVLSDYTLEIVGGEAVTRADPTPTAVPTVGPGSKLSLQMRPSREAAAPVVAAAWLVRGGTLRPWPVTPEVSPTGAVRITGTWETLGFAELEPGEWEALLVVAAPDHLPDEADIRETLTEPPPADAPWRLQHARFIVHRAP